MVSIFCENINFALKNMAKILFIFISLGIYFCETFGRDIHIFNEHDGTTSKPQSDVTNVKSIVLSTVKHLTDEDDLDSVFFTAKNTNEKERILHDVTTQTSQEQKMLTSLQNNSTTSTYDVATNLEIDDATFKNEMTTFRGAQNSDHYTTKSDVIDLIKTNTKVFNINSSTEYSLNVSKANENLDNLVSMGTTVHTLSEHSTLSDEMKPSNKLTSAAIHNHINTGHSSSRFHGTNTTPPLFGTEVTGLNHPTKTDVTVASSLQNHTFKPNTEIPMQDRTQEKKPLTKSLYSDVTVTTQDQEITSTVGYSSNTMAINTSSSFLTLIITSLITKFPELSSTVVSSTNNNHNELYPVNPTDVSTIQDSVTTLETINSTQATHRSSPALTTSKLENNATSFHPSTTESPYIDDYNEEDEYMDMNKTESSDYYESNDIENHRNKSWLQTPSIGSTNPVVIEHSNDSNVNVPDSIVTINPLVKTTLPENDINVIKPANEPPLPTDPAENEVGLSTTTKSHLSKTSLNNLQPSDIPIYTPPVEVPKTTIDSFIISINPVKPPYPTKQISHKTTTPLSNAGNDIMGHDDSDTVALSPTNNPSGADVLNMPPLYIEIRLLMINSELCYRDKVDTFRTVLANLVGQANKSLKISYKQVVYIPLGVRCKERSKGVGDFYRHLGKRSIERSIFIYVEDKKGNYSMRLTDQLAQMLQLKQGVKIFQGTEFQDKVLDISIHPAKSSVSFPPVVLKQVPLATGIIVTIVAVVVIVLLVLGFTILQVYIRWQRRGVKQMRVATISTRPSMVDAQSLADSIQMQAFVRMESGRFSRRRMTKGSFAYVNPGLELQDHRGHTSNPLTFIGLAEMLKDVEEINDEFLMLPNILSTISDLPPGVDDKNRYSNVIPNPKTRVPLHCFNVKDAIEGADYINANFIRGYQCYPNCYIATQAPLEKTVYDFWRMVWQQNSAVIVMLTPLEEEQLLKCYEYWPNTEGGDIVQVYGEYRISQERRVVMPEWIQTTLKLKYKKAKQQKEIQHFWLTSWPKKGLPDYRTLIKFMVQIRPAMDESAGPPIVHCSPGTGRTGVIIALDLCMLSFEDSSTVNVLNTVHQLRKDRGGMVQTKDQYGFIYKVIFEYAKMLNNPISSVRSSFSSETSSFLQDSRLTF